MFDIIHLLRNQIPTNSKVIAKINLHFHDRCKMGLRKVAWNINSSPTDHRVALQVSLNMVSTAYLVDVLKNDTVKLKF